MKMTGTFITVGLMVGLLAFGQKDDKEKSFQDLLQNQTDEIYDSLLKIRRDFHVNPELSGQEQRTSKKIADYLESLGLEVKTNIGGYGVVGILNGHNNGKRIAWRADIDALKTDYPDIVDFKSIKPGIRHICGHDVHTTIGLGIANVLSHYREKIKGTVYFIFQPSEENYKGAESMIDDGLFDIISPDEIYGLHINPMPTGFISAKSGLVYAYLKVINVSYKDISKKEAIADFTKNLISKVQDVQSDSKFWDSRNLGDPNVGIANPNTVFQNYLTVDKDYKIEEVGNHLNVMTVLTGSNKSQLDSIPGRLEQTIRNSDYADDLVSVNYSFEYPTVINDKNLTSKSLSSITEIFGEQTVIPNYGVIPNMNDDFSYFQLKVTGVYYFLGGSNYQEGMISMPHSPNFAVDEECIKVGVKYFSSMIVERLNDK
jgi:metal-dependent amidase/aminoacylase/carboxypeptidase family protein